MEVEYGREKSHTKHQRSSNSDWFKVNQLKIGTQYQFWVTTSTKKGEGKYDSLKLHILEEESFKVTDLPWLQHQEHHHLKLGGFFM